jgi:Arc/MetJ-type ribon-helix-helix transcriptional regulator
MNVKLSPSLEKRLAEHLARDGRYASADAFVEQAVEAQMAADALDGELEEIRERIRIADREVEAGEFVEHSASEVTQLARDVHERGMKRLRGR